MSADNNGTCPSCGEQWSLREYWEFHTDADERGEFDAQPATISMDYRCSCRGCGYRDKFTASHTYSTGGKS